MTKRIRAAGPQDAESYRRRYVRLGYLCKLGPDPPRRKHFRPWGECRARRDSSL